MKGIHRKLALCTLLATALLVHADPVKRINEIKMDPRFIYGEATKATTEEACDAALNILQRNIQQWHGEKDKTNVGKPLRDLTFLADTISAMRGGLHRVLAYVAMEKVEETLRHDEEQLKQPGNGATNDLLPGSPLHKDPQTDGLLKDLRGKTTYDEFENLVTQDIKEGKVSNASRDITIQTSDSYLAVFRRTKKGDILLNLLAPGDGKRDDLVSGEKIDPNVYVQDKDSYILLWFVPSTPNKENR